MSSISEWQAAGEGKEGWVKVYFEDTEMLQVSRSLIVEFEAISKARRDEYYANRSIGAQGIVIESLAPVEETDAGEDNE